MSCGCLIYADDIKQTVSSDLLLYTAVSYFFFQHKHGILNETNLKHDLSNFCGWFFDNELSIYFREDKTKFILFGTKRKLRKAGKLNIAYQGIDIK